VWHSWMTKKVALAAGIRSENIIGVGKGGGKESEVYSNGEKAKKKKGGVWQGKFFPVRTDPWRNRPREFLRGCDGREKKKAGDEDKGGYLKKSHALCVCCMHFL